MSKVVSLSYKKSQKLLQSLRDQQRHSLGTGFESANILLSPKYRLKDKDLRKIHKAARVGDAARVQQLLLGKCCVNDRDKKKRTALHIACAYSLPKVVKALIEGKCEMDAVDSDRCTGLVKAVQCKEEECATILLENGANPNIVDAQGNSALHYAVYYKNTSLAARLLEHEVNIEEKNKSGFTPFLLAVSENKLKMAKFLSVKNANVHATDNQKRTALMPAVSHDSTDIVRFILQQGVDLFWKDALGLTAIDYADDFKYYDNMKILLEYKEKRDEKSERSLNKLVEGSAEEDSSRRKDQQSQKVEKMKKEGLAEPGTERKEQEAAEGTTSVHDPWRLDGGGDDQLQEDATKPRASKEDEDVAHTLATEKEDKDESSWDSESVSETLPLICIGVDGMLQVNGQAVENPEKYLHWLVITFTFYLELLSMCIMLHAICINHLVSNLIQRNRKGKNSLPDQMKGVGDAQAFTPAEPDLELTSEEEHKGPARNEDKQCQVEEERKQGWDGGEASESLCAAALDHGGCGSPLTRKNGTSGSQRSPSADSEEQDGDSALNIKEEKKIGHENWSSGDFVTELTAGESELAAHLLRVKDTCGLNDSSPDKGRSANQKSKEKHKVLETNAMEDADDLTQPSESCSEDEADLYPNRQQTETEKEPWKLLNRKTGNMENREAKEEGMKTEPVRSRVALKHKEKKKENKGVKTELPGKDGLSTEDAEDQQYAMALGSLHMRAKQTLSQLQEAQDRQREVIQSSQKTQDHLQKFQAKCSEAEVTIQEQGKKIAELQELWASLTRNKEEQLKKLNKIILCLKCSLDQKKSKNEELEREFTEIKKHLEIMKRKLNDHENGEFSCHGDLKVKELEVNISVDVLKNEIHELKEKWGTINAKYLPLNVQFKYIEQELLSIKIAQKQYERLHKDQKVLEREVLDLQHQLRENMAKSEDKKHELALRDSNNDSVMSQMELRLKNLESELEKMEAEGESNARKAEKYRQCCVKERELSKILSGKLSKTNGKLSKVRTDILLATERNRTMQSALSMRPVPKCPGVTKCNTYVKCDASFMTSRTPEPSPSSSQPSESRRKSLLKKQQQMVKDITAEVDKAAAELECWSLEAYPSGSKQDLL
ncbi:ankyrin repeat domain-containing protein 26-like [Alexandromys fortis]|uniref:ankyrin repeat domain-containing protein 26-like n=1 Tax=Alexandromys fortis TaxID=100897 RepID=UPI002152DD40|nr:ankyrin repeat domain-containing protein 26-like [Microtus fortis]